MREVEKEAKQAITGFGWNHMSTSSMLLGEDHLPIPNTRSHMILFLPITIPTEASSRNRLYHRYIIRYMLKAASADKTM